MYQGLKINRYKLRENAKDLFKIEEDFDIIDNYKESIEKYIYTDIKMTDFRDSIEKAFQSRLQILLSSVLLRSLLLKEGLVLALNNNNFPTYYAVLKSFLEVPALLGYLVYLIYNNQDLNKIILAMKKLQLGTREAGSLSVGKEEALNILTMFEKLDSVLKGIAADGKDTEEREKILKGEDILTSTYKDICNFGHINWSAHLSVGILNKESIWEAKKNALGYKEELYGFYMPAFTIGISMVKICCSVLARNQKVNNFNLLSNKHYF